jgi:hypothetical protein
MLNFGAQEVLMARKVFLTALALSLAGAAFAGADPSPDVNLFGVLFLFFAFVAWFCWDDIQAGYSYLDECGVAREPPSGLMFIRFAPMHLRELAGRMNRRH